MEYDFFGESGFGESGRQRLRQVITESCPQMPSICKQVGHLEKFWLFCPF